MPCSTKESQAKSARKHYLSHTKEMKDRAKEFSKKARERNKRIVEDWKKLHPCIDCGETDIVVLQCDHINGEDKDDAVANLVNAPIGVKRLMEELAKCVSRCANDHLRRHHGERIRAKQDSQEQAAEPY